jgi:hypothetical protein
VTQLVFLGDVYLPTAYSLSREFDGEVVFNLEYPITRCEQGYPGKVNLKAAQNHIEETFGRKPTAVCLANNHIMDYGETGFTETLRELAATGIRYFGAGYLSDGCNNGLVVEVDTVSVALLGYACRSTSAIFATPESPGVLPIDADRIRKDIVAVRHRGAQRVIVSLHWGAEEVYLPKPADVVLARRIIDAGADLIIGHHAHRIQPFEVYQGKYIFYGLGNCIMPDLDVPAYFKDSGVFTRRYVKAQRTWNKQSLAITYQPRTGEVQLSKLHFDQGTLCERASGQFALRLKLISSVNYERQFRRSYLLGMFRTSAARFLTDPKLPRVRHLRSLISVAADRNYK